MSGDKRIEDELKNETEKWLERAEEKFNGLRAGKDWKSGETFLKNIRAYIEDSKWFLEKGDLIRAFECVIWAWAWMDIGLELGLVVSDF